MFCFFFCLNVEQTVDEVLVILVGYNHGIPSRVRKPHRVSREARIRTFIFLENGVHIPPPAQPRVVLPKFRAQTNPFSKHLIVSLLPVEEVPITAEIGTLAVILLVVSHLRCFFALKELGLI